MDFLNFNYDKEKDVMYIRFGDDNLSDLREVEKDVFIKRDIHSKKITSIILSNFSQKRNKDEFKKEKQKTIDLTSFFMKNFKTYHSFDDFLSTYNNDFFDEKFEVKKEKNRINPEEDDIL